MTKNRKSAGAATVAQTTPNLHPSSVLMHQVPVASSAPPKTGRMKRLSDWGRRWAGFLGIVVAVAGIGVSAYQAYLAREVSRLSVKPNIRFAAYLEGPGKKNGLYLLNLGLGPARLSKLSVEVGGQPFDLLRSDGQSLALKAMEANMECFTAIAPEVGTVIKAGEEAPLMGSTSATTLPLCPLLVGKTFAVQTIRVDAEYFSMFDEKFSSSQPIHLDLPGIFDRIKNILPK